MDVNPAIVVVTSDWHTISTIGLCPPAVQLDDGGKYKPSPGQRWLWRCWLDFWGKVRTLKTKLGAIVYAVHNGDLGDGDHHDTAQIACSNPKTMIDVAVEVAQPALDVADYNFVVRGTPVHVGPSAWLEEEIATRIGAVQESPGVYSWWWLPLIAGGVLFDIAHHGSGSLKEWTRGNATNRAAVETIVEYAKSRDPLPQLVIRSHRHIFEDSGLNQPCRVVITPGWQLKTEHVNKFAPARLADIGGLIVICHNGEYDLRLVRYQPRRRKPWKA